MPILSLRHSARPRCPAWLPFLAAVALTGCDDSPAAAPTPAVVAARTFVLSGSQVPDYRRTTNASVNPDALARQANDPGLADRLRSEGFIDGALEVYSSPEHATTVLPFATISSQALIFRDSGGASSFFTEERRRIDVAPGGGGVITPMSGAPAGGVDEVVAFDASQRSTPGNAGSPPRAFIALVRKGQVVAEVYADAGPDSATPGQFSGYVAAEEALLQTPPQAASS